MKGIGQVQVSKGWFSRYQLLAILPTLQSEALASFSPWRRAYKCPVYSLAPDPPWADATPSKDNASIPARVGERVTEEICTRCGVKVNGVSWNKVQTSLPTTVYSFESCHFDSGTFLIKCHYHDVWLHIVQIRMSCIAFCYNPLAGRGCWSKSFIRMWSHCGGISVYVSGKPITLTFV